MKTGRQWHGITEGMSAEELRIHREYEYLRAIGHATNATRGRRGGSRKHREKVEARAAQRFAKLQEVTR